jgi:murein hydrolase activator
MASRCSDGAGGGRVVPARALLLLALTAAPVLVLTLAAAQSAGPPAATEPGQRAAERIRTLLKEGEGLASDESVILAELRRFEVARQIAIEELAGIERDRTDTEAALIAASARADALRRTAEQEQPDVESRLVRVYKLGQAGLWRIVLDVDDLRSAGRAYRTASALTRIDRDRVSRHERTLDALERQEQELRQRIAHLAELEPRARAARAAADQVVARRVALVATIDARRDLNAQLTAELQAARERLQASVNRIATGSDAVVLPIRAFRGALAWPARGRMVAGFGQRSPGPGGAAATSGGIEIGLLEGQTVRAVHEGTVVYAGPFTGYGTLVIVEHGERAHSLYGFLSSLSVSKGDRVAAQAALGASGIDLGGAGALYFELRVDGKAVDPLQWLARE